MCGGSGSGFPARRVSRPAKHPEGANKLSGRASPAGRVGRDARHGRRAADPDWNPVRPAPFTRRDGELSGAAFTRLGAAFSGSRVEFPSLTVEIRSSMAESRALGEESCSSRGAFRSPRCCKFATRGGICDTQSRFFEARGSIFATHGSVGGTRGRFSPARGRVSLARGRISHVAKTGLLVGFHLKASLSK